MYRLLAFSFFLNSSQFSHTFHHLRYQPIVTLLIWKSDHDVPVGPVIHLTHRPGLGGDAKHGEKSTASRVFQWWIATNDAVIGESLKFDHCCTKELADDVFDMASPFGLFPPIGAVIKRNMELDILPSQSLVAPTESFLWGVYNELWWPEWELVTPGKLWKTLYWCSVMAMEPLVSLKTC